MAISGRKSKMAKGRLDNAIVQFTNTEWAEDTTKNGKDVVQLSTTFVDADGQEHPYNFILGDQKYVRVEDGKLASVDDSRDYQISDRSPAGKLLVSLDECGFSPKKLDNIGDAPEALNGQWVKVVQQASSSLKTDGTPFTDLIVEELVDDPTSGGKSKASAKSAAKGTVGKGKASAPVVDEDDDDEETGAEADEDEDEEEEEDEDEESDESDDDEADPIAEAATEAVLAILADPDATVRNYDADANDGGVSIKQLYSAAFAAFKGDKKAKGPACSLVNDPNFHKANAKAGLYQFDPKTGIVTANPAKPAKKGKR